MSDPVSSGYGLSSEMGPKSHTTITLPIWKEGENLLTYTATSHPELAVPPGRVIGVVLKQTKNPTSTTTYEYCLFGGIYRKELMEWLILRILFSQFLN
ncbi:hypothetical protein AVEN_32514-1 [Araneus ventricosus]|uniref:Uncharacterized protein n=1 Tax=Araneus ventricosus TaxID=182803 RepID=A0A4Y2G6B0_ARAVE|nr:hypothetical protein AVEN_32514-1 [Araneus ventricosus]